MHIPTSDRPTTLYSLGVIVSMGYPGAAAVCFLDRKCCLYRPDGSRRLADNALVAFTLLIVESKPEDKNTMATLIVNLINGEN